MGRRERAAEWQPHDGSVADGLPPHPLGRDAAQVGPQRPQRAPWATTATCPGRPGWLAASKSSAKPATRQYRSRSDSPSGGRASGSITRSPATPLSAAGTIDGGSALQQAEAPLAQPGVAGDVQPQRRGERGRGRHGAPQVAGVYRADRQAAQLVGGVPGLEGAAAGQPRLVGLSLRQAEAVPGALAVPDEPQDRAGDRGLQTAGAGAGGGSVSRTMARSVRRVCEGSLKNGCLQQPCSILSAWRAWMSG